ncbi:MAG TPA: tautomerase family protein [Caulobacteraceae bacterium]|jgi:phenylpyruvate tautomerase PptA (4-oxalocrotonate tautomerase family)|nr:tautomerase family protein [Caulobacteraceae bacterium]
MPLYRISTGDGVLSREAKATLAAEITEFHCKMTGLDKAFVKLVFETFPADHGFVGGRTGSATILTVLIRAGRSTEYKHEMLRQLWAMLQRATGATDAEMLVAIQEAPASQAMEMGQIMPELET